MSGAVATARPAQALRVRRESQRPGVARVVTKTNNMEDESAKPEPKLYGMHHSYTRMPERAANAMRSIHTGSNSRQTPWQAALNAHLPLPEPLPHQRLPGDADLCFAHEGDPDGPEGEAAPPQHARGALRQRHAILRRLPDRRSP